MNFKKYENYVSLIQGDRKLNTGLKNIKTLEKLIKDQNKKLLVKEFKQVERRQQIKQEESDNFRNNLKNFNGLAYRHLNILSSLRNGLVESTIGAGTGLGVMILGLIGGKDETLAQMDRKEERNDFLKIGQSSSQKEDVYNFETREFNFHADNTVSTVASSISQMLTLIYGGGALAKGTTKAFGIGEKVAGRVGLFSSSFIMQVGGSYQEAITNGLKGGEALGYSMLSATIQSGLELVSPNEVLLGKGSGITKELIKNACKSGSKESLKMIGKTFAKNVGLEIVEENIQEALQLASGNLINMAANGAFGSELKSDWSWKNFASTAIITTLTTGITTGTSTGLQMNNLSSQDKTTLIEHIKNDKGTYIEVIEMIDKAIAGKIRIPNIDTQQLQDLKGLLNSNETTGNSDYFNGKSKKLFEGDGTQARGNSEMMDNILSEINEKNKSAKLEELRKTITEQYKESTGEMLKLSDEQLLSILYAHEKKGKLGELTLGQLRQKVKVLDDTITDPKVRRFLLEAGFCGKINLHESMNNLGKSINGVTENIKNINKQLQGTKEQLFEIKKIKNLLDKINNASTVNQQDIKNVVQKIRNLEDNIGTKFENLYQIMNQETNGIPDILKQLHNNGEYIKDKAGLQITESLRKFLERQGNELKILNETVGEMYYNLKSYEYIVDKILGNSGNFYEGVKFKKIIAYIENFLERYNYLNTSINQSKSWLEAFGKESYKQTNNYFNGKSHQFEVTETQARGNSEMMDNLLNQINEQNQSKKLEELRKNISEQYKQSTGEELNLTDEQLLSILDAHEQDGKLGELTLGQLRQKVKILDETITDPKVRRFLLEAGFCGRPQEVHQNINIGNQNYEITYRGNYGEMKITNGDGTITNIDFGINGKESKHFEFSIEYGGKIENYTTIEQLCKISEEMGAGGKIGFEKGLIRNLDNKVEKQILERFINSENFSENAILYDKYDKRHTFNVFEKFLSFNIELPQKLFTKDLLSQLINSNTFFEARAKVNHQGNELNKIYFHEMIGKYIDGIDLNSCNSELLSDLIIDYHFDKISYNVFLDIKELLRFQIEKGNFLSNEKLKIYKDILNIDKLSNEEKIELHKSLIGKNVAEIFENDVQKARGISKKEIADSILNHETIKQYKDEELSKKYGVNIYNFDGQPFYALAKVGKIDRVNPEYAVTRSFSLVGTECIGVWGDPGNHTFLYEGLTPQQIIHISNNDSGSRSGMHDEYGQKTDYIFRLGSSSELLSNTRGYNELIILEKGTGDTAENNQLNEIKPIAIYCYEITEDIIKTAKEYEVGIALINKNKYEEKNTPNKGHDGIFQEYMYPGNFNKSEDYYYAKENRRSELCTFDNMEEIDNMIE